MSFNNNDILLLARAGFSAQQISALNMLNNQPMQQSVQQQTQQPLYGYPNFVQPLIQQQNAQNMTQQSQNNMDAILNGLQNIQATMLQNNINNSSQPQVETVDDILASIINPTPNINEKGENK